MRALSADAVSEIDGPGWTWRRGPSTPPRLTVYRSEANLHKVDLLFVLDCSRSMQGPRITALKNTLLEFSRQATDSGINIGIRVFGDQHVWNGQDRNAERLARRDTRLLLPVEPFPGEQFETLIRGLEVRGETPMFYTLIDAMQQDFKNAPADHARQIVLISDGADNWTSVGLRPNVSDLQTAFQAAPTTINAIGFQTDAIGFSQLQRIADVTGGQAAYVAEANDLLRNVFGLTGLFTWKLFRQSSTGEAEQVHEAFVGYQPSPIEFPAGTYTLSIFDKIGRKVAERKDIALLPGQNHELIHVGETINYAPPKPQNDIGDILTPDGKHIFRLMKADYSPSSQKPAASDGTLDVTFALQSIDSTAWTPGAFDLLVQPDSSTTYAVTGLHASGQLSDPSSPPGLLPNVPGYHFPVWNITLENWPAGDSDATFTLLTPETSTATPEVIIPFNGLLPHVIPDGPTITRARSPAIRRLVAQYLPDATSPSGRVSLDHRRNNRMGNTPSPLAKASAPTALSVTRLQVTGPVTLYRRFTTGRSLSTAITSFDTGAPEPTARIRTVTRGDQALTGHIDLRLKWVNRQGPDGPG